MKRLKSPVIPWILFGVTVLLLAAMVHRLKELETGPAKPGPALAKHNDDGSAGRPGPAAPRPSAPAGDTRPPGVAAQTSIVGTPGGEIVLNPSAGRNSPEGLLARQRTTERRIHREMAGFISELKLEPATRTKLLNHLVDRAQTIQDVEESAHMKGITDPAAVAQLRDEAIRRLSPQPDEFLDAESLALTREVLLMEKEFAQLSNSLQLDAGFRGVPLSVTQQLKLARAMAAANYTPLPDATRRINAIVGVPSTTPPEDAAYFNDLAGSILTPEQAVALRATQENKKAQEDLAARTLQEALQAQQAHAGNRPRR